MHFSSASASVLALFVACASFASVSAVPTTPSDSLISTGAPKSPVSASEHFTAKFCSKPSLRGTCTDGIKGSLQIYGCECLPITHTSRPHQTEYIHPESAEIEGVGMIYSLFQEPACLQPVGELSVDNHKAKETFNDLSPMYRDARSVLVCRVQ
ncbi:hypothetical protein BJ138DRAFT_390364 [Hygrophoropsis aurantiaca]|uniref:Uncharacterized protein n=1 Tax=Hygrophoropsis aurantiaca TaxID=72124 RepID=A0ACB8A491_9AGAM|nr:hypothetical protein BJ138DRAFT_390364 [Hygrophoropsis aurantiaca]